MTHFGALVFASLLVALEPDDYSLAEGFEVKSAVEPGLIKHPMMATLDDYGRLFVTESSGDNLTKDQLLEQKSHTIKLLTDTDGNGVFDKATTFADGMTFPQGALWIYDSLYVMSPPGLWYLEDTNNDGVADVRQLLIDGFDFTGNAADVHGPFMHPNGRLYWCHGRQGHEVKDPESGDIVSKAEGARIWSCDINGQDIRVHAGGGMDNPVEIDFTSTGEIVGSVNLFYGRPRGDVLVHWLYGGAYPRQDQGMVLAEFDQTGPLLDELHNFGHAAISGMCRYRSGKLNPAWKDQWLASHYNTNQITRTETAIKGSGLASVNTETIFKLNKPHAHLTDVLEDRNGDLLVIDTGGWFRDGSSSKPQISRPKVLGGIYRIAKQNQDYQPAEYPSPEQWQAMDPIDVAELLKGEDSFIQERAITELAIRGHSSIPELRIILEEDENSTPQARRNAIWALARMKFTDSPELIENALQDADPTVQIAACKAIAVTRAWQQIASSQNNEMRYELERNKTISGALARLVRAGSPEVARNAAVAIGTMAETRAMGSLVGRIGRGNYDRALQHSITYALLEIEAPDRLLNILKIGNPHQQNVALWALEGMESYQLGPLDIVLLLDNPDPMLKQSVEEIASRHPEWDAALANQFFLFTDALTEAREARILALTPKFANTPPMQDFMAYLVEHEIPEVAQIAEKLVPSLQGFEFTRPWEKLIKGWLSQSAKLELALDTLNNNPNPQFNSELERIAADTSIDKALRMKALLTRRRGNNEPAPISDEGFELINQTLSNGEASAETRLQAIETLTLSELNDTRGLQIAGLIDRTNPMELTKLLKVFPTIKDPKLAKVMAEKLPKAPGFATLDLAQIRNTFSSFNQDIQNSINSAINRAEAASEDRQARLKSLVENLDKGDAAKGQQLFESGKGSCINCHQVNKTGGVMGPDLSKLGKIRKPESFFESVLYPSESITRNFETREVELNDASVHSGLIHSQTPDEISLTNQAGAIKQISRSEISQIRSHATSLMPAGLDQSMTESELIDLVSYLSGLR